MSLSSGTTKVVPFQDRFMRPPLAAVGVLLSEGQEVLGALDGLADTAQEGLEIFAVLNEIDFGGVDDEKIAG